MNQWQRHCWLPGGDQVGKCLSLAQPLQSHPAPPPATYRQESGTKKGECPCPPALDWQRIILEVALSRPLSPPHEDPLRSSPQKGQNNCSLTFTILTAMLGWPALDGIPRAPSQPRPLWKGPRLWNSLPGSKRKNGGQPDKRERSKNGERRLPNRTSAWGGWVGLRKLRTQCTQFMGDNAGHRAQGYFWRSEPSENLLKAMDATTGKMHIYT